MGNISEVRVSSTREDDMLGAVLVVARKLLTLSSQLDGEMERFRRGEYLLLVRW